MAQTATTEQLAALLRIDARTVRRYAATGILPRARHPDGSPLRGVFELIPCLHAYHDHLAKERSLGALNDAEFRSERTRLTRLQCERIELELNQLKGELYPFAQIELFFTDILTNFKMRTLAVPNRIIPRFQAAGLITQPQVGKAYQLFTEAMEELLTVLSSLTAAEFMDRNRGRIEEMIMERAKAAVAFDQPEEDYDDQPSEESETSAAS